MTGIDFLTSVPAQHLSHPIPAGDVPQGPVFALAASADDRRLAVALNLSGRDLERRYQAFCELQAQGFEIVHEWSDLHLEASCKRVSDDRYRGGASQRFGWRRSELMEDVLHLSEYAPELDHARARSKLTRGFVRGADAVVFGNTTSTSPCKNSAAA